MNYSNEDNSTSNPDCVVTHQNTVNKDQSPVDNGVKKIKKMKIKKSKIFSSGSIVNYDKKLVYTGFVLIRKAKRIKRKLLHILRRINCVFVEFKNMFNRNFKIFAVHNGIDIEKKQADLKAFTIENNEAAAKGFVSFAAHLLKSFARYIVNMGKKFFSSVNYVAPILAAVCFGGVVWTTMNMTFALEVNYNNETIGYISDESVFDNAEKEMLKRIVFEDYIMPHEAAPYFSIKPVKKDDLSNQNELTNKIIKASGNELTEASGLYIDNKFLGAVQNGIELNYLLEDVKDQYRSDAENEVVEFVKEVKTVGGLYPLTSIVDIRLLKNEVSKEESQQKVYRAVAGDAPISIAQKNGIPYSQLKALNPDIEKELFVGQEILVEKAVPMLEVKTIRTEVEEEEEAFKIEQVQDTSKYQGYVSITQKGQKGVKEVTSEVTYVDGVELERKILDTRIVRDPINEKVVVGGKRPLDQVPSGAQSTSNYFRWPADGGNVTCAFGSAGYWGHTGLDIGGLPQGSPVRASAAGTVVKVQYDTWNYGYHVIVDHGGGVQTLYAHNSKIYVKPGDWVEQGDLLAGMGRTGRASGIHVHFEIRVNGKYMNPVNYIGKNSPY